MPGGKAGVLHHTDAAAVERQRARHADEVIVRPAGNACLRQFEDRVRSGIQRQIAFQPQRSRALPGGESTAVVDSHSARNRAGAAERAAVTDEHASTRIAHGAIDEQRAAIDRQSAAEIIDSAIDRQRVALHLEEPSGARKIAGEREIAGAADGHAGANGSDGVAKRQRAAGRVAQPGDAVERDRACAKGIGIADLDQRLANVGAARVGVVAIEGQRAAAKDCQPVTTFDDPVQRGNGALAAVIAVELVHR